MTSFWAVVGVGTVAGAALLLWGRKSPDSAPTDPGAEEEAVVEAISKRPAVARFLTRLGRRLGGSVMVLGAFVAVVVLAALAGALLDMVRAGSGFARWDQAVAEWGATNATAASTTLLNIITQLGASWLAIPVAAGVGYYGYRRWGSWNAMWFMAVVYGGHAIISNLLKLVIERDRPPVEHLAGTVSSSFPSTHSGTAAAVWAGAALVLGADRSWLTRAWLAAGSVVIAVAVAASRALLGVHWLTDILAGLAIGWAWFLLVAISFGGRALKLGEPVDRVKRNQEEPSR